MTETTEMEVGDMRLVAGESPGAVTVYRHGEKVGEITAQGLHEAAELPDEELSKKWTAWKGTDNE